MQVAEMRFLSTSFILLINLHVSVICLCSNGWTQYRRYFSSITILCLSQTLSLSLSHPALFPLLSVEYERAWQTFPAYHCYEINFSESHHLHFTQMFEHNITIIMMIVQVMPQFRVSLQNCRLRSQRHQLHSQRCHLKCFLYKPQIVASLMIVTYNFYMFITQAFKIS